MVDIFGHLDHIHCWSSSVVWLLNIALTGESLLPEISRNVSATERLHPRCLAESIGRWYWRYLGIESCEIKHAPLGAHTSDPCFGGGRYVRPIDSSSRFWLNWGQVDRRDYEHCSHCLSHPERR